MWLIYWLMDGFFIFEFTFSFSFLITTNYNASLQYSLCFTMLPIFLAILSFLTDLRDLRKSKDFSTDFPNPASSYTYFSFQLVQYPHQHQQDLQFRLRVSLRLIFTLVCTCVCFYVRFNWITCCLISNTTSSRIYTLKDRHVLLWLWLADLRTCQTDYTSMKMGSFIYVYIWL